MQKIFILEDDDSLRSMVLYALSSAGFAGEGFGESHSLWERLHTELPALLLLDIMLPDEDGITILKQLKSTTQYKNLPVVMLTAKGTEFDRIQGLDLGADDYITKPFSIMELISRVRAVLRRCNAKDSSDMNMEGITLDSERRTVSANGEPVTLTFKEFELLQALMKNQGIVLSRDRLLEQVWGYDYTGESRTVDMHIKSLRQKLGECGSALVTVRNVGYKIGG